MRLPYGEPRRIGEQTKLASAHGCLETAPRPTRTILGFPRGVAANRRLATAGMGFAPHSSGRPVSRHLRRSLGDRCCLESIARNLVRLGRGVSLWSAGPLAVQRPALDGPLDGLHLYQLQDVAAVVLVSLWVCDAAAPHS